MNCRQFFHGLGFGNGTGGGLPMQICGSHCSTISGNRPYHKRSNGSLLSQFAGDFAASTCAYLRNDPFKIFLPLFGLPEPKKTAAKRHNQYCCFSFPRSSDDELFKRLSCASFSTCLFLLFLWGNGLFGLKIEVPSSTPNTGRYSIKGLTAPPPNLFGEKLSDNDPVTDVV